VNHCGLLLVLQRAHQNFLLIGETGIIKTTKKVHFPCGEKNFAVKIVI
jgi:HrpA-like RNA helicase